MGYDVGMCWRMACVAARDVAGCEHRCMALIGGLPVRAAHSPSCVHGNVAPLRMHGALWCVIHKVKLES